MTVALEVFSAFILEECASRGNRGTKRRRGKDEEEEELKGLKAAEDAADKKKMKLSSLPITALRYLQGLDAYVAAGKKRKASVLGSDNHIDSFKVSSTGNNRAIKRPREDECLLAIAAIAFEALPTEMLWLIVTNYLGAKEVCLLSSTCHFFAGLSRSEELWKVLYARDFGLVLPTQFHVRFGKSWLWLYQSRAVFFHSRAQIAGPKVGSLVDNNVHFSGDWLDGKFHGYGIAIALPGEGMWDAGLVCEGEWRDDALHGFGKETYPDGEFLEGNWVNNALCGQGMRKWKDGGVYKGDFVDSLPHGKGLMVYPSAGGTYVGEWKEGKRHGQGVMIYSDKTKYAGLWFNDKRNGQGIVHYADGGQYKGEWSEDLRHGFGSMKWPSGNVRLYEGGWRNDKQDGRGVCYYADGNRFEGCWMQNKVLTSLRRSL